MLNHQQEAAEKKKKQKQAESTIDEKAELESQYEDDFERKNEVEPTSSKVQLPKVKNMTRNVVKSGKKSETV